MSSMTGYDVIFPKWWTTVDIVLNNQVHVFLIYTAITFLRRKKGKNTWSIGSDNYLVIYLNWYPVEHSKVI